MAERADVVHHPEPVALGSEYYHSRCLGEQHLTDIIGTDRSLLIGLDGDLFVNAAEIMRWEGNWTEAGAKWQGGSGFSNQLYWLFSRQSVVVGQANYGMASIKAMLSFAVYLNDVELYNYAMNAFIQDNCAGLFAQYHPETGQSVEAGRDQSMCLRLLPERVSTDIRKVTPCQVLAGLRTAHELDRARASIYTAWAIISCSKRPSTQPSTI